MPLNIQLNIQCLKYMYVSKKVVKILLFWKSKKFIANGKMYIKNCKIVKNTRNTQEFLIFEKVVNLLLT